MSTRIRGLFLGLAMSAITPLVNLNADTIMTTVTEKQEAIMKPQVKVGGDGSLMHYHVDAPGPVKNFYWGCAGAACGWTYACKPEICGGHKEVEINGNSVDWWVWTTSADNCAYTLYTVY